LKGDGSECQLGLGLVVYSLVMLFILPVQFIGLSGQTETEPTRFYGFKNQFNRFSISVRFSRLIFYRFSQFFRLIGFFEHPYFILKRL